MLQTKHAPCTSLGILPSHHVINADLSSLTLSVIDAKSLFHILLETIASAKNDFEISLPGHVLSVIGSHDVGTGYTWGERTENVLDMMLVVLVYPETFCDSVVGDKSHQSTMPFRKLYLLDSGLQYRITAQHEYVFQVTMHTESFVDHASVFPTCLANLIYQFSLFSKSET
jgi:hypothetical protein